MIAPKKLIVLCFAFFPLLSQGSTELDLSHFKPIPIVEGGRKMPFDSYARNIVLQFSGRSRVTRAETQKIDATTWFAQALFTPRVVLNDPLFLIDNPEFAYAIGIPPKDSRRYSFEDLRPGIDTLKELSESALALSKDERDYLEDEFIRVQQNVLHFTILISIMDFTRPSQAYAIDEPEIRNILQLDTNAVMFSYMELYQKADLISKNIQEASSKPPEEWTPTQQSLFRLGNAMMRDSDLHGTLPFGIIPLTAHGEEQWISPWNLFTLDLPDRELKQLLPLLNQMAKGFVLGEQTIFDEAALSYLDIIRKRAGDDREIQNLESEVSYNEWNLLWWSKWLYLLPFLLGLTAHLFRLTMLRKIAFGLFLFITLLHLTGLAWRIYLTARPPVTNLYGSFVFVSLVASVLCLIAEKTGKNGLGSLCGGFVGFSLLAVAGRFATQGDTFEKVQAVLNSNFWLSTHVVAITCGYAGVWLAGVLGHIYLGVMAWKPEPKRLQEIMRPMMGFLGFGLTFSFLGTMLGGVWADQSWGRFWGWDPKENGALLIVLVVAIIYHARWGGLIRERGVAVGCALSNIVVMMAWLGVNLMGVGLHSYGFTSGLAWKLYLYFAAELVIIGLLFLATQKQKKSS